MIAEAYRDDDGYGTEHPYTLNARGNLVRWTWLAGDGAAARDQYAVLVPVVEQVLDPGHTDTLTVRCELTYWTKEAGTGR